MRAASSISPLAGAASIIVKDGHRIAYTSDAYATEYGSANLQEESKRKRRIAAGGLQSSWWLRSLMNPFRYPKVAFQFVSHRVLRWIITPFAMLSRALCMQRGRHIVINLPGSEKAARENWDGIVWNNRLETRFEIEWAWIGSNRRSDWYTTMEEGRRISRLQLERFKARHGHRVEELGDAFKSAALKWLRKQPRMKTCKPEDIEQVQRVWDDNGKRRFEIIAKGKRYTIR